MKKFLKQTGAVILSLCLILGLFAVWPAVSNNKGISTETAYAAGNNTVDYTVQWDSSGQNIIRITYTSSDKNGWVYYSIQDAGSDAPTSGEIISANDGKNYLPLNTALGRQHGTTTVNAQSTSAKDVYLVFMEYPSSSNVIYDVTKISLPARSSGVIGTGDSSESGSVSFKAARKDGDNAALTVTPSVAGTLHYIVKGASESAPSNTELLAAEGISESANVTKTSTIPLGDTPAEAKTIYVLYVSNDGTQIGSGSLDIAAYDTSKYSAEIEKDTLYLGTVTDDYTTGNVSKTDTISNTGSGTLTFSVDTSAEGYDTFSKYFTVDTSGAKNIASGSDGSVTVHPKEGLEPGTYSASFTLIDKISDDTTLTLGPVKVQMTVVQKGDSMPDGIRSPEGEYTPGSESLGGGTDTSKITIDNKVAYCVNYYFLLSNQSAAMDKIYHNKFGKLSNVTAQELDAYTGLNLNVSQDQKIYPPNNNGYTPVKEGDPNSKVLENVRKVLYNGYDTDAAGISTKYDFNLTISYRQEYAFEIATQCAIWHYTDTNASGDPLSFSELKSHIKNVYSTVPSWGWDDIEGIYNILIGEDQSIQLLDPPADFETDLFIADNPINNVWTQNLITGSAQMTDISITKVWDDEGNPNGNRPSPSAFKSWLHLYRNGEDVTETYADKLTVKNNGNNTYTVTWTSLPGKTDQYSVKEEIPESYKTVYAVSGSSDATNGGSITNSDTSKAVTDISATKTWKDNSDSQNTRPTQDEFKKWVKLYADGIEKKDAAAEISGSGDSWTIKYKNLPKFNLKHQEIVYTIKEEIPDNAKYKASYGSDAEAASDNGVIVNTLTENTSVKVTKAWKDADGTINAPEGASVKLTLCENGTASDQTITLDGTADSNGESSAWTAEWKDLPKYDNNGKEISYSVFESEGQKGFISSNASADTALDASGSSLTITNTKIGTASLTLGAQKIFSGGTLNGDDFEFKLEKLDNGQYTTVETKKNDAQGAVSFDALQYDYSDAGKTYTYRVTEIAGSDSHITYDNAVYRVKVEVQRDGTAITAVPAYEKSTDNGSTWTHVTDMIFSNTNKETTSTKWHLEAKKDTTDHSAIPSGAFIFQVFDAQGNKCYLTAEGKITTTAEGNTPLTATNNADGTIVFPEVTATEEQAATTYTIKEVGFSNDQYAAAWKAADTTAAGITATVTITDNDGTLTPAVAYSDQVTNGSTEPLTFYNTRKNVTLHIQKNWSGVNEDAQPDSATFVVTRKTADEADYSVVKKENGEDLTVTLNKTGGWKEDLTDLPAVNADGREYTYSVRETGFMKDGQTAELNFKVETAAGEDTVSEGTLTKNVTVTNSRNTDVIDIPVTKVWADGVSADGMPDKSVTVVLKQNGTAIDSAALKADGDEAGSWKHTFKGLDKYAPDGSAYTYTVEEANTNYKVSVAQNDENDVTKGFTITNEQSEEKISIPVEKKWAEGVSGESATVILTRDGEQIGDEVILKEDEDSSKSWKHTFTDLDKYAKDGHEYRYSVEEVSNNYKAIISRNDQFDITKGFTITNDQSDAKVVLTVEKKWADGASGESAVVELLKNGEETGTKATLNENNGWTHTFKDLEKYGPDGKAIEYSVKELTNDYNVTYTKVEDGKIIVTNSPKGTDNTDETIDIPVEKKWADGASGESAVVELLKNGQETGTKVTLNEDNGWTDKFKDLEKYDSDGQAINYSVKELTNNYSVTYTKTEDGKIIVTNSPKGTDSTDETVDIPVVKKWAEGVSGESAEIILKRNGSQIDSVTLNEANNWKHTFQNLPKFDSNGQSYDYTVEEKADNYKVTVTRNDNVDISKGFTVTNDQSDKKVSIPVEKKWAEGASGEEAVIVLVRNGEKTDQKVVLTEDNNWKGSFDNLDKYDKAGKEISYTVSEETNSYRPIITSDGNGGYVITNVPLDSETPKDDQPSTPDNQYDSSPSDTPSSYESDQEDQQSVDSSKHVSSTTEKTTTFHSSTTSAAPKTGDTAPWAGYLVIAGAAAAALFVLIRRVRR